MRAKHEIIAELLQREQAASEPGAQLCYALYRKNMEAWDHYDGMRLLDTLAAVEASNWHSLTCAADPTHRDHAHYAAHTANYERSLTIIAEIRAFLAAE